MATTKKLPKPPREVPRETRLDTLPKGFRDRIELLFAKMRARGHNAIPGESWRTNRRQSFLYGFGRRYDDGRGRVTNAPTAFESLHAYGCAVDVWDGDNKRAPWNPVRPTVFYADAQEIAREVGLRWGADWNNNGKTADERFMDRPHFQDLRAPLKPDADDRANLAAGRLADFYAKYKIDGTGAVPPT